MSFLRLSSRRSERQQESQREIATPQPSQRPKHVNYESEGRLATLDAHLEALMLHYKVMRSFAYSMRFLRIKLGITDDEAYKLLKEHDDDVYTALAVARNDREKQKEKTQTK